MSWRGAGSFAALMFAGVVGLPSTVQAQLFPNLPIRRERVERPMEPPFYSHVRQNYYGYYPTCWQRFPEGWACPCPNPDAPDIAAAFKARPRDEKPEPLPADDLGPLPDSGDAGTAAPRQKPTGVPPLPEGRRSPFDLDTKPNDAGRAEPPPITNPDLPAPRSGGLPESPPAATSPIPAPGGGRAMPPAGGASPDPFLPPTSAVAPNPSLPEVAVASVPATRGNARPLLELPDFAGVPASATGGEVVSAEPFPSSLPPSGSAIENPAPAAPGAGDAHAGPQRKSVIGGLFGGMGGRRRR